MARAETGKQPGRTPRKTSRAAPEPSVNGGRLRTGNPGDLGGKPGRSGRKTDAFKERLEAVRDEHSLPMLAEILGGEIRYPLKPVCEHCGRTSHPERGGQLCLAAKRHNSPTATRSEHVMHVRAYSATLRSL